MVIDRQLGEGRGGRKAPRYETHGAVESSAMLHQRNLSNMYVGK